MKPWRRIEPTAVQQVGYRTVVEKTFIDSTGRRHVFGTYCKEGQEIAAVVGVTSGKKVVILRQFRVGPERIMEELPGGFVDHGESVEAAARREFLEETGYEVGRLEYLGVHHKDTYMNATWHFFLATDCTPKAERKLEIEEADTELALISIKQLFDNARNDRMTDAIGVYWAQDKLKALQEEK